MPRALVACDSARRTDWMKVTSTTSGTVTPGQLLHGSMQRVADYRLTATLSSLLATWMHGRSASMHGLSAGFSCTSSDLLRSTLCLPEVKKQEAATVQIYGMPIIWTEMLERTSSVRGKLIFRVSHIENTVRPTLIRANSRSVGLHHGLQHVRTTESLVDYSSFSSIRTPSWLL
jgi:hypothetical protein